MSTNPPSFEPHSVDLISVNDSCITSVSLYSSRAEITRLFKFNVKVGLNHVNITGLPNVLDQDSLKVEGTGHATIHDVTIAAIPRSVRPSQSDQLEQLLRQKKKTEQAIDRCTLATKSLETYLGTLNVKDVGVSEVANIVKSYQKTGEELDNEVTGLRDEVERLDVEIFTEKEKLAGSMDDQKLGMKATVGVFADVEGEVEIKLVYAVNRAHWHALYDIRVDMHTKEKPVELTYKASITQTTGEDWQDVDLTLETAEPTFGVGIPQLPPWTISVYRPSSFGKKSKGFPTPGSRRLSMLSVSSDAVPLHPPAAAPPAFLEGEIPVMRSQEANINSKGNITATFAVPGKIAIPSDGAVHNVTIVKLNLDAQMRWVTVPKKEAKTHLKAKIKNASDYTLLSGQGSVYVNGSFIARTNVPPVSPEESFDCPLGLDPSVRVTYHPRIKKTTRTGFYNKTTTQVHSQRITIFNTKTSAIDDLKVTEQFPVSEDSLITVKNISPGLVDVLKESTSGEIKVPEKIRISSGIFAQWNGADEPDMNVESLGKDGKFDWICSVPAQGKIDLFLQYEVTAPPRTQISGL